MATGDLILGDSAVFDRPQLFTANLFSGHLGAAARSLYKPESLSLDERKKLAARYGLTGPLAAAVNITSHPTVLLGLAATAAFKLPPVASLTPYAEQAGGLIKRFLPLEFTMPFHKVFEGRRLPALMEELNREVTGFRSGYGERWVAIMEDFAKSTGGKFSNVDAVRVAAHLDGLDDPKSPAWQSFLGQLRKDVGRVASERQFGISRGQVDALESALSEGRLFSPLTDAQRKVATRIRSEVLDDVYKRLLSDPATAKPILKVLSRQTGINLLKEDRGTLIKYLREYLPHISIMTPEERAVQHSEAVRELLGKAATASESELRSVLPSAAREAGQAKAATVGQATKSALPRIGAMIPNADHLALITGDERVLGVLRSMGMQRPTYSLNLPEVLEQYLDSASRTYAWTVPQAGAPVLKGERQALGRRILTEILDMEAGDMNSRAKASLAVQTYVPLMMGGMTPRQARHSLEWAGWKANIANSLTSGALGNYLRKEAPDLQKTMVGWLTTDPTSSYSGMGKLISNWFYGATIGGNPLPMGMNLLQPITTLAPTIGLRNTIRGYTETAAGLPKLWKLMAEGVSTDDALKRVFPAFARMEAELVPVSRAHTLGLVEESFKRYMAAPPSVKKAAEKGYNALMFGFSQAELSNRLVAFNGARAVAMKQLPISRFYDVVSGAVVEGRTASKELISRTADRVAASIVNETQFAGGTLARPSGTVDWWAPWAQFTTFPLRLTGFAADTMLRNPGILGRGLLTTGAAYGIGKELFGSDISRGLLTGGMATPSDYGPFAPLPVVPPLLQIAGAAGLSLATGRSDPLRESVPLLLPGGIPAARAVGLLGAAPNPYVQGAAQGAAEFINRPYADYQNRTPDGRIAVYTKVGALQGYFTPAQLYARALGFHGREQEAEQAVTQFLLKQRDRARKLKQDFMRAVYENDAGSMLRINQEWEQQYPRMGGIPITKTDIRALHMRRDVARVERLLEGMPADLRPAYQEAVAVTLGPQYPQMFGLWQELGIGGTVAMRDEYRAVPRGAVEEKVNQNLHGVKLRDKLKAAGAYHRDQAVEAYRGASAPGYVGYGSY